MRLPVRVGVLVRERIPAGLTSGVGAGATEQVGVGVAVRVATETTARLRMAVADRKGSGTLSGIASKAASKAASRTVSETVSRAAGVGARIKQRVRAGLAGRAAVAVPARIHLRVGPSVPAGRPRRPARWRAVRPRLAVGAAAVVGALR